MGEELIVKTMLMFIGTLLTAISVILVWGFQKLITTLLSHSQEFLKIDNRLGSIDKSLHSLEIRKESKFTEIDKKLVAIEHLEREQNTYAFKLKLIELKLGELSAH